MRKSSLSFSVDNRQISMIEELCIVRGESRSEMFAGWLLRAYNAQGSAHILGSHITPIQHRTWGPNGDKCNPKAIGGCLICYPLGGEEE